jgi:hypothetical protein
MPVQSVDANTRKLSEIEAEIIQKSDVIFEDLKKIFETRRAAGDPKALDFNLGFANGKGQLSENGSGHADAPIKYVRYPKFHISKNYKFIEKMNFLKEKKVYELGVGPGYLFYLLERMLGCDMYGCDIRVETHEVYRRARTVLHVQDKVKESRVAYQRDIGLEPGTEAIIAFWTVFNKKWGVREHQWFLDECAEKMVGDKYVVFRFNNIGYTDNEEVYSFYQKNSILPIEDDPNFCVLKLS